MHNYRHTRQLHMDSKSHFKLNLPKTELPIPVPHLPITAFVHGALPVFLISVPGSPIKIRCEH